MAGRVELYHGQELVKSVVWKAKPQIDRITEKWKMLYGKGFSKTVIVVIEDLKPEPVPKKVPEPEPEQKKQRSPYRKGDIVKYGTVNRPVKSGIKYFDNKH